MSHDSMPENIDRDVRVEDHRFPAHGGIPNHPSFPLLVYRSVFLKVSETPAYDFEQLFALNSWNGSWRNGVFPYHHFHAEAHEVLGVYAGGATVRFGGEGGEDVSVSCGDVVIIPAGVGHKAISADAEFGVVGAYPSGQAPDLRRDQGDIDEGLISMIQSVKYPNSDPIFGEKGPLRRFWSESAEN